MVQDKERDQQDASPARQAETQAESAMNPGGQQQSQQQREGQQQGQGTPGQGGQQQGDQKQGDQPERRDQH